MPKLHYGPTSPYSAKVRMAAAYAGYPLDAVVTDTNTPDADFLHANPLGKIPVLVLEDGSAVYDSRTITQFINRSVAGSPLFPRGATKRREAEQLEALADGICDVLLAHVYERRSRPASSVHQPWLDKQWEKAERALDYLNAAPPRLGSKLTAGLIAVRACLAYATLRFGGQWERGRSKLVKWAKRFDERFPQLTAYLPGAQA